MVIASHRATSSCFGLATTRAVQQGPEGIEPIEIGVGLHFGEAVVGHVGSKNRHEYTVIGDTVNAAARLESLTKGLGYPVLCSAVAAAALIDDAALDDLGPQVVKGRAPIAVFGWRPRQRE